MQEMIRTAIQESEVSVPGETGFGLKISGAPDRDIGGGTVGGIRGGGGGGVGVRGGVGGDLSRYPLGVRRRLLHAVIRPIENRFEIVQCQTVTSLDVNTRRSQLESFFNTVTLAGEEGLMVKDLTGSYVIGERSKKAAKWVKMKPEYGDQTTDLDLIVIGGRKFFYCFVLFCFVLFCLLFFLFSLV